MDNDSGLREVMNEIGFTKLSSPETIKIEMGKVNVAKVKEDNPDEDNFGLKA